jgi:hypothetical protein
MPLDSVTDVAKNSTRFQPRHAARSVSQRHVGVSVGPSSGCTSIWPSTSSQAKTASGPVRKTLPVGTPLNRKQVRHLARRFKTIRHCLAALEPSERINDERGQLASQSYFLEKSPLGSCVRTSRGLFLLVHLTMYGRGFMRPAAAPTWRVEHTGCALTRYGLDSDLIALFAQCGRGVSRSKAACHRTLKTVSTQIQWTPRDSAMQQKNGCQGDVLSSISLPLFQPTDIATYRNLCFINVSASHHRK